MYFEDLLKEQYAYMDKTYGGYDYIVNLTDANVKAIVEIDYFIVNLKKLGIDEPEIGNILNKKDHLTIDGVEKLYNMMGINCSR